MLSSTPARARHAMARVLHPAFLAGFLLTGVGIAFNVSHGYHLGGSDTLRAVGMAGVFLAAIVLKDSLLGQIVVAMRARRPGLALVCALGFLLGATGSLIAAFGSASEGREEKSDPRQAQITAYDTADKTARDAEKRLDELGRTGTVAEAKAAVARLIAGMDAGIAKRTSACAVLEPQGTGKRQAAVNREACQPVIEAQVAIATAEEAQRLRSRLETARETLAHGKPKAADPLVANLTALWSRVSGSTGDLDFGAVLSLLVALIVELGAPVSWAIWQMCGPQARESVAMGFSEVTFAERKTSALAGERLPLPDGFPALNTFSGEQPDLLPENDQPEPPNGGSRKRKTRPATANVAANVVTFPVGGKHPVVAALESAGGAVASNRQLAALMGVTDGEATKRRAEVGHLLVEQQDGKARRIALRP